MEGVEIPEYLKDAPELSYDCLYFYTCFLDMCTCRRFCEGHLLNFSILELLEYCEKLNIVGESRDELIYALQIIDQSYVKVSNGLIRPAKESKRTGGRNR